MELAAFAEKLSSFESDSRERILAAAGFARESLPEQKSSVLGTASILLDLGLDADAILAALILEGFRDKDPLPNVLEAQVSPAAALLAQGVKKLDALKTNIKTTFEAENIRNMLFALTEDTRAIIIKLAEKLHALRLLDASPDEEQKRKTAARECLDIYAPLADRLGISWIKAEMEDLSLKFLNRETYQQIKNIVAQKRVQRGLFLELAQEAIVGEAKKAGLEIDVKSRAKHFYSVYMKMRKRGKPADGIHDLSGIRVLCDSIENCYMLLGIVHRLWEPLSGSFKDYIAKPKPNGYQSLHTAVKIEEIADGENEAGEEARLLEIQIRTKEMHRVAEYGVASHWVYKQGASRDASQPQNVGIVNRLKGWKRDSGQGEASGSGWLDDIKRELFQKSVYVFTPQGKVIKLPAGATPIDFAYYVHTAVGERCVGAKAGGSIIPLNTPLKNAQIVEVLTSPSAHPNLNWLQVAKSSKARNKIRSWLEKNDEAFMAEKSASEKKKPTSDPPAASHTPSKDAARGPELDAVQVVQRVIQPLSSAMRVRIEDEKNLMLRFARCCNPITGDSIIGYVSRGRGIIIHRKDCASIASNPEFAKRQIDADWENAESALVKRFRVQAKLSPNLFSEIEGAIRKWQGHLIEGRLEETAANRLGGMFTMQLTRADDIKAVMKNIRGIPGILGIQPID